MDACSPSIEDEGVGAGDINQSIRDQTDELAKFAKKVAKSNTEALIEAIQEVMKDFTVIINDQLGESFKELKEATKNLVTWQENYKDDMDSLRQDLKAVIKATQEARQVMGDSANILSTIATSMTDINGSLSKMKEHIEKLSPVVQVMVESLKAFAEMKEQAKQAIPKLEESVEQMNTTLGTHLEAFEKEFKDKLKEMSDELKSAQNEWSGSLRTGIEGVLQKMANDLGKIVNKTVGDYKTLIDKIHAELGRLERASRDDRTL
ncbi:MAG: hypothetical protein GDA54_00455 [Alphaproteobacteria bacterium GM7ARS4]|nr:hypothetical protein [Alphaproteobacteria bacterium GM7ARS4]